MRAGYPARAARLIRLRTPLVERLKTIRDLRSYPPWPRQRERSLAGQGLRSNSDSRPPPWNPKSKRLTSISTPSKVTRGKPNSATPRPRRASKKRVYAECRTTRERATSFSRQGCARLEPTGLARGHGRKAGGWIVSQPNVCHQSTIRKRKCGRLSYARNCGPSGKSQPDARSREGRRALEDEVWSNDRF